MGSSQTKEEVILAQNAAGGANKADVEQLYTQISATNIILIIILFLVIVILAYLLYKSYKNCHKKWITYEINRHNLRRSIYRYRDMVIGRKANEEEGNNPSND